MPTIFLHLGKFQPAKWGIFNRRKLGNIQPALTIAHPILLDVHGLSGFLGQFVGFVVGFLDLPDTRMPHGFSNIDAICRVCRVLFREREPQRI
jgi:hypothetical protein